MKIKNLSLIISFTFLSLFSTTMHCNKNQLINLLETFGNKSHSLCDFAIALHLLKDLDAKDIEKIIDNSNTLTWDLIVPIIVASYATYKLSIQPYKPKDNKFVAYSKGTAIALSSGLAAYVLGSIPKQCLKNILNQAIVLKKKIEKALSLEPLK